eukprot:Platyproteum_vivax@DN6419_c0_g1_i1.p1
MYCEPMQQYNFVKEKCLVNGTLHMNGHAEESWQIREVWADNLEEEFENIQKILEKHKYVAMDTEFPGIVVKPTNIKDDLDYNYQTVKLNVDMLKVIQLGITFADEFGNLPQGVSTWQFNFQFSLESDMYAENSIRFLKKSGIDFIRHRDNGINVQQFGEQIMNSGLVMNDDVKWISFHGTYDFGYLLKILTCQKLPDLESEFFCSLHLYFPALYDVKYLLQNASLRAGSLQKIADHLEVKRIGPSHQAGSDSLVTCNTFFRLMDNYFDNKIDDAKFAGVIFGLGNGFAYV